jgi:hypothetical protein
MPTKSIPQLGDANWGTTLNNHILQTTDPANGGPIIIFGAGPSGLTADDKGKTYLNNFTGNLHEWDGTKYKIHCGNTVNIRDFGYPSTSLTQNGDDTPIFLAAVNYALVNGIKEVYIPASLGPFNIICAYRIQAEIPAGDFTIVGDSNSTIITAVDTDAYAFTFSNKGNYKLKGLKFIGRGPAAFGGSPFCNGIRITGNAAGSNFVFDYVFTEIGNNELTGVSQNIGIRKEVPCDCSFYKTSISGDIGYWSSAGGNDYWDHNRTLGSRICAVYYNNKNSTVPSRVVL